MITIGLPKIEDLERINELAVKLHDLHVKWRPDIFEHTSIIIGKEELNEMIEQRQIYVAKLSEKIVGYIIIGNMREGIKPGYKYRKQLPIEAMIVDENVRGQGIGTKLLEFVIRYAKENNCTDVRLTVNEENESAIRVYEKIGMKVKNIAYNLKLDE